MASHERRITRFLTNIKCTNEDKPSHILLPPTLMEDQRDLDPTVVRQLHILIEVVTKKRLI